MSKYKCKLELIGGLTDTIVNPSHMVQLSEEFKKIKHHIIDGSHSLFLQKELFSDLLDIINPIKPAKPKTKTIEDK